jgi:hypothetical protein
VQYILENLRLTNLHVLLAKGQEENIIRAHLLKPTSRKEAKPMEKCKLCALQDTKPCYECNECLGGDDHFKQLPPEASKPEGSEKG